MPSDCRGWRPTLARAWRRRALSLRGKTVLVTGGTGFIGGRLVEKLALEQEARVRVLVRSFSTAARVARFPVQFVFGDANDAAVVAAAAEGCDIVVHCAHQTGVGRRQAEIAAQATRNVGAAALRGGLARMIHVSSFSVYGPTLDGDLTESSAWRKSENTYVRAKRAAERTVEALHRDEGLPAVILQPTIVYGPFCKAWTMLPVEEVKRGHVALVDGGAGLCNVVYVDDVVDAMILAATSPDVVGEKFLISAAEPITWKRFWGAFEEALGIQATVPISESEFDAIVRSRRRRGGTVSQLVRLARDPRTTRRLEQMLPRVAASARFLKRHSSRASVERRKSPVYEEPSHRAAINGTGEPRLPSQASPEMYRSRTHVRIDKARALLGYNPRFDFERGMSLTVQYLHWANLV